MNFQKPITHRVLVALLFTALALFSTLPASAAPVVEGDPDLLFVVQPGECAGCTQAELDALEDGLTALQILSYAYNRSFFPELCVAKTSLARDMAVLSYELVRDGHITQSRWQDHLDTLARRAGSLYYETLWESVGAARYGGLPYKSMGRPAPVPDYYFAIQLSRIYWHTVAGIWDVDVWTRALGEMPQGYNSVVDAALRWTGRPRQAVDLHIAGSRPQDVWREMEVAVLTALPDDFHAGTAVADAELLAADYDTFLANNMFKTMWNGCGVQAAHNLQRYAINLSDVVWFFDGNSTGTGTDTCTEPGEDTCDEEGEEDDEEEGPRYNLPESGPDDPYAPPNPDDNSGIPGPWDNPAPPGGGPDNPFPPCWAFGCGWGTNPGIDIFDDDPQGGRFSDPPNEDPPRLGIGSACQIIAQLGYPLPPQCVPQVNGGNGGGDGSGNGSGGGDGGGTGTGGAGGGNGGGGGGVTLEDFGPLGPLHDIPDFHDFDW